VRFVSSSSKMMQEGYRPPTWLSSMPRLVASSLVLVGLSTPAISGPCFTLTPLGLPRSPSLGAPIVGHAPQTAPGSGAAIRSTLALISGIAIAARGFRRSKTQIVQKPYRRAALALHALPGDFDAVQQAAELATYVQQWVEAHHVGQMPTELPSLPAIEFSQPAFAEDAVTAAAADKKEVVLEEGEKYLFGPDGNVLLDPMNNQPLKDDWWNGFVGLQADAIKELDRNLRAAGVNQAFGWTVVLYTVLVKVAFYPLQAGQLRSTSMMQLLQPKVKEIQARYKDDPNTQAQLLSTLYGVMDVNPLAGCLPIFIQLPFFWSLYSVWRRLYIEKFEFYDESWLWVPSLAQPNPDFNLKFDWLLEFENGAPVMGWEDYGSYLIFPSLLVGSTILQYVQTQGQKKEQPDEEKNLVLEVLPIVSVVLIGTISLELPQAVSVYYFTNTALTTAQTAWVKYTLREEIPGYAEYEKTGKFPDGAFEELANRTAPAPAGIHEAAMRGVGQLEAFLESEKGKDLDVNALDDKSIAPIGYACARGDSEAVKLLVKKGADLKALDGLGNTLLHYAAGYGHLDLLKELIEMDVDWTYDGKKWHELENQKGQTAFDAARVNRKGKVVDWMSKHLNIARPIGDEEEVPHKADANKAEAVDVEVTQSEESEQTKAARAALLAAASATVKAAEEAENAARAERAAEAAAAEEAAPEKVPQASAADKKAKS